VAGPPPSEQFRSLGRIYQLVSEFVAPIGLGLVVDWQFGTRPWGTLVGTLVGLLLGGFGVARIIRQMDAADRKPGKGPP
jgi:F0F1-type ATP synthase assembly protein I